MTPPARRPDAPFTLKGVVAAALAYSAVNAALTLAAGPALALDDVKLNVLTQSLQGGYLPDNPPLFEWVLYAAQRALGPTLLSFVAVKSLFLVLTAAFTFLAAREAGGDARTGAASAFALPLIPQFGWSFHQTLTHSAALFAATAFFWFALLRLKRCRRLIDYALLGLAIGAGLLSKYSFAGAAVAALAAAMLHAPLRVAMLSPKIVISAAAAALVLAPHLQWVFSFNAGVAASVGERLAADGTYAERAVEGVWAVMWAFISFLAPAAAAMLAAGSARVSALRGARSVLSDATVLAVSGLLLAVGALGLSNFQERYAIPFLFPGFLWLTVTACGAAAAPNSPRNFAALALGVVALFTVVRAGEVIAPGKPFCKDCRQHVPYAYLQEALRGRTLRNATLVGFDDLSAGNLRRMYPQTRVVSSHLPTYAPPPASEDGDCYFIWSIDLSPPPDPSAISQLDSSSFIRAGGAWRRRMNSEKNPRRTDWTIAPVDPSTPIGAALCRP